jgi:hypothetical protein
MTLQITAVRPDRAASLAPARAIVMTLRSARRLFGLAATSAVTVALPLGPPA